MRNAGALESRNRNELLDGRLVLSGTQLTGLVRFVVAWTMFVRLGVVRTVNSNCPLVSMRRFVIIAGGGGGAVATMTSPVMPNDAWPGSVQMYGKLPGAGNV